MAVCARLSLVLHLLFSTVVSTELGNEAIPAYVQPNTDTSPAKPDGPIVPDRSKPTVTVTLSRAHPPAQTIFVQPVPVEGCKKVQAAGVKGDETRAEAIKEAFRHGWSGYSKYAYGMDELQPLSAKGNNNRYGWGLTIVDSIDTAIIMGLNDIVSDMLDFIGKIDFTRTRADHINVFETNIRYIGGLLSAYDLLKSGQFSGNYDEDQVDALLEQAVTLTDRVAHAFDTRTGLPAADLDYNNGRPITATYTDPSNNATYNSTNAASIGTFILEFTRLSDLTGNQTYRQIAERANSYLIKPSPSPIYPGLIGTQFDIDTGEMLTFDGGWQAGVDSALEYLIKTYQYHTTNTTTTYKDFWLKAVESTTENIAVHPYGFPDLTFVTRLDNNGSLEYLADTFSCFAGGNFLLGGAFLDSPDITDLGVAWTDGCHKSYNSTLTGLGPLAWAWFNETNQAYDADNENDAAARKNAARKGFWIFPQVENWFSRPEPLESVFYAHRITGDERWADHNWEIFKALNETSRNSIAFAAVNNVDMPDGGSLSDSLDSFFFAEVLKYLYLTFAEPDVIDLSEWVFNTEGHPFRATCAGGASSSHGSAHVHGRRHIHGLPL
ncbi:putative mannosyl-oligosaccharide alpha-1,2-mannosidase [Fulvia fulva]|uniref:alpha-1,2-Mannosidase n=1 Tax=Passalora fulva TaxID=5499 RepID=A0A9Q8UUC1_PASFU|nr:putative mannosyl-oligosaccharide alpha-1,2-mannosidase [Fulvia fulva]KAK4627927.1 putative mannosyl-oligosaccharide alpha-1,2-mannosidase [Fulvia fulva]UJO22794.1 putative mannosyl-oligosaccharide alpha-1,2-mannosidase [Fulvia fulva]